MSAAPGWCPCRMVPVIETSLGSEVLTLARVRSVTSSCLSLEIKYSLRPLFWSSARNLNKYFIVLLKTINSFCLQVEIGRKTCKSQSHFLDTRQSSDPSLAPHHNFSLLPPGEHFDTGLLVARPTPLIGKFLLQLFSFLLLELLALLLLEVIPPVVLQLGSALLVTPAITDIFISYFAIF